MGTTKNMPHNSLVERRKKIVKQEAEDRAKQALIKKFDGLIDHDAVLNVKEIKRELLNEVRRGDAPATHEQLIRLQVATMEAVNDITDNLYQKEMKKVRKNPAVLKWVAKNKLEIAKVCGQEMRKLSNERWVMVHGKRNVNITAKVDIDKYLDEKVKSEIIEVRGEEVDTEQNPVENGISDEVDKEDISD